MNKEEILKRFTEAIEKQIPKKPIEYHYEDSREEPKIKLTCPASCRVSMQWGKYSVKYCPHCGQAIDWSDNNE